MLASNPCESIAGCLVASLLFPTGCHLLLDRHDPQELPDAAGGGPASGPATASASVGGAGTGGAGASGPGAGGFGGAAGAASGGDSASSAGGSAGVGGAGGAGGAGAAGGLGGAALAGAGGGGGGDGGAASSSSSSTGGGGAASSSSTGTGGSGGGPLAIVTGQTNPTQIFVDAQYVFWLAEADDTGQTGSIWRADHDGANATPLVQNLDNPKGLAGSSATSMVYYTEDAGGFLTPPAIGVFRVPKGGGAVVALDTGDGLNAGYAVLRNFLYSEAWGIGTEARVRKSATGANSPAYCYPYVSPVKGGRIPAITAYGSYIFSFDTTSGDIIRTTGLDCDSTANSYVVFAANQPTTRALHNDPVWLFWITADAVLRQDQDLAGGNMLALASNQNKPTALAVIDSGIVYTTQGNGSIGAGAVMFTNASQMPKQLADGQSDPRGVATLKGPPFDIAFWTNRATGEIMRLDSRALIGGRTMLYRFEGFDVDDEIFTLRRDGVDVPLRPQALDVLLYLVRHRDRVVTKQELLETVWRGIAVSDSTLPQAILAVRRALDDDDTAAKIIQTIRGRGYRFIADVEVSDAGRSDPRQTQSVGPFVGQVGTLERLTEVVRKASAGRPGIGLLAGGPGAGKTRTLAELSRVARADQTRVLEARCHADAGVPDLWPWVRLLRAYAETSRLPLARDAGKLADDSAAPAPAEAAGGGPERFATFDGVVQILRRAAQKETLLLLIDDVQHADAASLLLLKLLVASLGDARVAIVASYRDPLPASHAVLARTLGAFTREQPSRRIALEKLSRDDVARIATALLAQAPDEMLMSRVMGKTDGNPLLVTQMLEAMSREGEVRPQGDGFTSALLSVDEMREAIGLQLEGVSESTRAVLSAAAVLGTDLSLSRLAATLDTTPATALERVEEALRARVLVKTPAGGYRFAHILVRDVLYRGLAAAERVALHEAAAVAALRDGAAEESVCHLERALRAISVPAVTAEVASEDAAGRAAALLTVLRGHRASPA